MAAQLITVAMSKAHLLRPDLADDNPDLLQKMAAAESSILLYINTTEYWRGISAEWTDAATVPVDVQHAILLKLAELFRFRGDEVGTIEASPRDDADSDMSPAIVRLLRRWRDPILV